MIIKSKKLREFARGQDCTLKIAGVCNYNSETSCLCHFPHSSSGVGLKSHDISAGIGCSSCHDAIDSRVDSREFKSNKDFYLRRSMIDTWLLFIDAGLIKIA